MSEQGRVGYYTHRPHSALGHRFLVLVACSPLLSTNPVSWPQAAM